MRKSTPKSLDHLFTPTSHLTDIQVRTVALTRLNQSVINLLPITLKNCCRVANYRQGVLIIEVSSASWLTRLRYEQEKLISGLRQQYLAGLASIQYKVNPVLDNRKYVLHNQPATYNARVLSPKSASLLLSLAQNATPSLQASLIKLAKHATKLDNNNSDK